MIDVYSSTKHMFSLCHSIGENRAQQEALVEAIKEIDMDTIGYSPRDKLARMLSLFYNGLAFGNWPWMVNGVNTLEDKK